MSATATQLQTISLMGIRPCSMHRASGAATMTMQGLIRVPGADSIPDVLEAVFSVWDSRDDMFAFDTMDPA